MSGQHRSSHDLPYGFFSAESFQQSLSCRAVAAWHEVISLTDAETLPMQIVELEWEG